MEDGMSEDITTIEGGIEDSASTKADPEAAPGNRLENARQRFAQVATGVEDRVGKMKEGAGGASAKVREQAERVGTVTRERYETTVENVKQGYGKAQKDFEHLTDDVNEYVRGNPGRSVLIAAGVGFLVGMLMRGGRR